MRCYLMYSGEGDVVQDELEELGQTEPVLAANTEAGDGLAVQLGVAQTRRGRVTDTRLSQC